MPINPTIYYMKIKVYDNKASIGLNRNFVATGQPIGIGGLNDQNYFTISRGQNANITINY